MRTATFRLPAHDRDALAGFGCLLVDRDQVRARLLAAVYDEGPVKLHPVAARSLAAHLDKLLAEGRARRVAQRYALGS